MVNVKCSALLKDEDNNLLVGFAVDFYYSYNGISYTKFDTAQTDSNGIAVTYRDIVTKTWIKSRFEGSPTYDPSEDIEYEIVEPTLVVSGVNVLGRGVGFSVWSVPQKGWVRGRPIACEDSGLLLGLWAWDNVKQRWEKGGGVIE